MRLPLVFDPRGVVLGVLSIALLACGGTPPAAAPDVPVVPSAPAPVASAASATGPDKAVVAACLATANATRARFSGEPAKISAKHLLVKHKAAKKADAAITRTREEACLRALEARDKLRNGADFAEVVKEYSEEAGAASRGGSVGSVERKDLAKPFADAAFELAVNQMSDIVETEFGFHVILRTE